MTPITSLEEIKNLGTILSVWAHPDDESFVAAGLLAAAVKNGQKVICITATKGEKGVQDETRWPASQLADIRTRELEASLKELGITQHFWLDYKDGECNTVPDAEAVQQLNVFAEKYQPDSILTFGPDGLTGHPDHQTINHWVQLLVAGLAQKPNVYHPVYTPDQYEQFLKPLDEKLDMFFNIDKPPLATKSDCAIALTLPDELLTQKWRALAAQESQMERLLALIPTEAKAGVFGQEYFIQAHY